MQYAHTDFTLFLLQEEDAPELAALEAACFVMPWGEEQYRKILNRHNAPESKTPARSGCCASSPVSEKQAVPTPFSELRPASAQLPDCLPATPVFGMRTMQGELAAYVCLGIYQTVHEAEIYTIAVRAPFRRQGLGKQLLLHALKTARGCGVKQILLEVRPSNAPALALYASTGFAVCGSRKKYYKDSGEDALILACDLTSATHNHFLTLWRKP